MAHRRLTNGGSDAEPTAPEEDEQPLPQEVAQQDGGLQWLSRSALPQQPELSLLIDTYFKVMHPVRCFGFIHRPSFMQKIEDQSEQDRNHNPLLLAVCAIAAKFVHNQQSISESTTLHALQSGSQWARKAQSLLLSHINRPTCETLMTYILLHEHELRVGNYVSAFMLTGLAVRLSQALGLNVDKQDEHSLKPPCFYESCRRTMWSTFILDAWVGSGVDELTMLHERNIHVPLPMAETDFIMEMEPSSQVHTSQYWQSLEQSQHLDLEAQFVLLLTLRKAVLRIVKHLDVIQPPWEAQSEWSKLYQDLKRWNSGLPASLRFTRSAIQKRKITNQHGGLLFLHLCYHQTVCDLTRIGMSDLFRIKNPLVFPAEQRQFLIDVQDDCFDNSMSVSAIFRDALTHGPEAYSDTWLCVVAHDVSRVQVHYRSKQLGSAAARETLVTDVDAALKTNAEMLTRLVPLIALAKPLLDATLNLVAAASVGEPVVHSGSRNSGASKSAEDVLNPLAIYRMARKHAMTQDNGDKDSEEVIETPPYFDHGQIHLSGEPARDPNAAVSLDAMAMYLPTSFDELQVYMGLTDLLPTYAPESYGADMLGPYYTEPQYDTGAFGSGEAGHSRA
ncbi:hypothetical protein VHEMI01206 [[Torrubiella] hemipterigena]|nr:hypothetical protein VHEMI01206 [[Torrubiella] hemipterigena]